MPSLKIASVMENSPGPYYKQVTSVCVCVCVCVCVLCVVCVCVCVCVCV